jgi:hypothetical protein
MRRLGWPRPRQKRRGIGGSGRESWDNDGSIHEDGDPAKGRTDLAGEGRNSVDPAGGAAASTNPTKATKKESAWQGPAPDLAGEFDAGYGRRSKGGLQQRGGEQPFVGRRRIRRPTTLGGAATADQAVDGAGRRAMRTGPGGHRWERRPTRSP